ncbi:hypothetical protein EMCRGX_G014888 [Ephydatia muelleri]|eukprot:Em0005g1131a
MHCIVLVLIFTEALGATLDMEWHSWKTRHAKKYEDETEETERRLIWNSNFERIIEHNRKRLSFTLGLNQFADLTNDEWRTLYLSPPLNTSDFMQNSRLHAPLVGGSLPDSVDWRQYGYVTQVKNQGQCGSCWAFSATGALEGQNFKKTGTLESLSEQQLLDCSWKYGNAGCNGGLMNYAFKYVKDYGVCSGDSYPYVGYLWVCKSKYCSKAASCSGYVNIQSASESDLMDATANIGPVSVAIDASSYAFQFYSSGVYSDSQCSSSKLNHGVLVVGYGTSSSKQGYWIVKNSWGTSWGNSGYILMSKGQNMCGIASAASYPYM